MAWSHTEMPNGVSCRIGALFRAAPEDSQEPAGSCFEEVGVSSGQGTSCEPRFSVGQAASWGHEGHGWAVPHSWRLRERQVWFQGTQSPVSVTWGAVKDTGSWG